MKISCVPRTCKVFIAKERCTDSVSAMPSFPGKCPGEMVAGGACWLCLAGRGGYVVQESVWMRWSGKCLGELLYKVVVLSFSLTTRSMYVPGQGGDWCLEKTFWKISDRQLLVKCYDNKMGVTLQLCHSSVDSVADG